MNGKYQFCNLDCVSRNTCCMFINVITKHARKGVGTEIQTKVRLLCATAFGFFCILSVSCPTPTENKTCIPHPFSILDSVYKPLHRTDLPSCVQRPGQSSYALSFHCADCFRLTHRQGWTFCQASISFPEQRESSEQHCDPDLTSPWPQMT